jgi:hypothetical protein
MLGVYTRLFALFDTHGRMIQWPRKENRMACCKTPKKTSKPAPKKEK